MYGSCEALVVSLTCNDVTLASGDYSVFVKALRPSFNITLILCYHEIIFGENSVESPAGELNNLIRIRKTNGNDLI